MVYYELKTNFNLIGFAKISKTCKIIKNQEYCKIKIADNYFLWIEIFLKNILILKE